MSRGHSMEYYLNLSASHAVWCGIVLFAASYIRGFSGFGFTAILMTGLTLILPIAEVVPVSIALEIIASLGQSYSIRRHVHWRRLFILLSAGAICTPVGVYLLALLPDVTLRGLVLAFIFATSVYLLISQKHLHDFKTGTVLLAGAVIGVVNGATALSGMVLALFLSLSNESPARIRATMIAFLFLADVWAGGLLFASGFYDSATFYRIAFSLPLLGLGVWLGSMHFASAPPDIFRKAVLWLLLVLSVFGIIMAMLAQFV